MKIWQDHRLSSTSPIPLLDPEELETIYDCELVLPPRNLLMKPGTQTIEGLFFILSLARLLGAREVFEIGTFTGLTAWSLARNLPKATVHTLDLPIESTPRLRLEESDHLNRLARPGRVYERLSAPGTIEQHWGDSATFDFSPFHGRCDLVYVDGAHSQEYVASDTDNALRMISSRGAIIWDDYWRDVSGVRTVLDARTDLHLRRVPATRLVVYLSQEARGSLRRAVDARRNDRAQRGP